MKHKILFRVTGLVMILAILLLAIPALPAYAANDVSLSKSTGKIGDSVTATGTNFTASTDTSERFARILFAKESIATGTSFNLDDVNFNELAFPKIGDEGDTDEGEFEATFTVPSELDDGTDTETVQPGTYYIYTLVSTSSNPTATYIYTRNTFTVTASAALNAAQPALGSAGITVVVSGTGFSASYPVIISFDSTVLSSTTLTNTSGAFSATITIPASATVASHTISVTVGATVKTTPFTVTASPILNALSPASGPAGTSVTVSGSGFLASYPVIVKFDSTVLSSNIVTDVNGAFSGTITIPSTATPGSRTITVTVSATIKTATFTITAPATTTPPTTTPPTTTPPTTTPPPTSSTKAISVNQNGRAVGSTIGIGGTGFTPGANVTIKFDDKQVASIKVEANGTFAAPFFTVPPGNHGDRTITASDGVNIVKATFTVESTAPKVPPPLKPQLEAKVKSPVLFDWQDVTDDSLPITYRLQIATDKSFGASTIALEKTGLDSSSYTLTEMEELKLAAKSNPYYWRIKAVDAAANESEWTGASEFSISGPFVFPRWALYLVIAGGAIVMFLIGLWVGRRTAFYY